METRQMEQFPAIFTLAGFGLFFMAIVMAGVLPLIAYANQTDDKISVEDLAADPGESFVALAAINEENFAQYWPDGPTPKNYAEMLEQGRDIYIAEGCWQCHTQQVRPVGNDELRYGAPTTLQEHNNDLMVPHLMGTRRVGPDLSRVGGQHSNGWYIAYLWNTRDVIPNSIMPSYEWFFEEKGVPNDKGYAIIAYIQWLGDYQPVMSEEE